MQSWIGEIQSMAFRLERAGRTVDDEDKILALTMGLPASYDAVVINFDATSADELTLEHVIARLLNEEQRQLGVVEKDLMASQDEANAVAVARARSQSKSASSDSVSCYFCDEKGHYKSDCPARQLWLKAREKKKGATVALVEELGSDPEDDGVW
ncbi:hypothetical protein BDN72DRAFT_827862 [Pluteus cervinus]|uniref:Uncharacterized protein n=1 Tax=Pluteus cervinus TaxID=181527 RepID=A0ACD3AB33_9AGAR|nr:hypothetical protein BDN72DRAFT_827862 [Pluteus cervinus]